MEALADLMRCSEGLALKIKNAFLESTGEALYSKYFAVRHDKETMTKIVDSIGTVGDYTSIALDSNDNPHISYFKAYGGDLKYAKRIFSLSPDDILGTWSSGVWYRNSETGIWVKITSPTNLVAAGDIDGDGIDDVIGVWNSGLWVKYSATGGWAKLASSLPAQIASGDMNGDGRDDVLGIWASGVWYRNSVSATWVKMSIDANLVAACDIDRDNTDDLIALPPLWALTAALPLRPAATQLPC